MPSTPAPLPSANPNLHRRPVAGMLAYALLSPLRPLLRLLQRPAPTGDPGAAAVFASYMVGDLYMALPALKRLAAAHPVRVLCRPDCVAILTREGLDVIPFDNAFFSRRTPASFLRTARAAWALRRAQDPAGPARTTRATHTARTTRTAFAAVVFDVDASPVTALWMRLAGVPRVVSYRRAYGTLFHETFPLPPAAVHQADRDLAVAEYAVSRLSPHSGVNGGSRAPVPFPQDAGDAPETSPPPVSPHAPWLLSVWTRKPAKNWPLENWDQLLEGLLDQGVTCAVLLAPDGDDAYARFRARWQGRVGFVAGTLDGIADAVRNVAGVIATDNFLGHMAGHYGKPVVWINMVSPAAQVMPRGPRTIQVAPEPLPAGSGVRDTVTVEAVRRAFDAARGPQAAGDTE